MIAKRLLMVCLMGVGIAAAEVSTWLGGTGNWNDASLWMGGIPGPNSTVLIDGGNSATSSVTLSSSTVIQALTIDSGDSLTTANGTSLTIGNGSAGAVTLNGTLTVAAEGSFTDLRLANGTTLDGTGTLVLSGSNARLFGVNGSDQLNLSGGLHLQGQGQFGAGALQVVSSGTLDINNGATLVLNPTLFTNNGVLQASGNSNALLSGGVFNNTNATIQTLDTSSFQLGGGVTLQGGTLNGNFIVPNANTAYLGGTILNQGTIHVSAGGSLTDLRGIEGLTLDGGGTISLEGTNARLFGQNGNSKVVNLNQTYRGNGQVLLGFMNFQNQGVMTIASGTNLNLTGGTLTNTGGTIHINSGATADLSAATLFNGTIEGPGTVRLLNGNTATLAGTITNNTDIQVLAGGSLTDLHVADGTSFNGSGAVLLSGPNARLYGVTATDQLLNPSGTLHLQGQGQVGAGGFLQVVNGGTVDIGNGSTLTVNPTLFTNNGILQASGNSTPLLSFGRFDNTNGTIQTLDNSSFLIGGNVTLQGGTLKGSFVELNGNLASLQGTIQNQGSFVVAAGGSLTDLKVTDGTVLNGSGTLTLSGSNARMYGVTASDAFTNNSTIAGNGQLGVGQLEIVNDGTIASAGGNLLVSPNALGLTNNGTLLAEAGSTLTVTGGLTNLSGNTLTGGVYDVQGTMRIGGLSLSNNSADIILDGATAQLLNNLNGANALGALGNNTSQGELHVINGNSVSTSTAFTNAGTVDVGAGSSFSNTGDFTQTGGVTHADGTIDPIGSFRLQAGILEGDGNLLANLIQTAGSVQPGDLAHNAIGALSVSGNYTMTSDSVDNFLLGAGAQDQLLVSGGANLDGTLNLLFLPSFSASDGDILRLITYTSHSGIFGAINGLNFDRYTLTPVYDVTEFDLKVGVNGPDVPEPSTWLTVLCGLVLLGVGATRLCRPASEGGANASH
jgi:adhesin HecA-like repeat protein